MPVWLKFGEALANLAKEEAPGASKLIQEAGEAAWSRIGKPGKTALAKAEEFLTNSSKNETEAHSYYPRLDRLELLKNPRTVTVETTHITSQTASIKSEKQFDCSATPTRRLLLDDQPVEYLDSHGPMRPEEFPMTLRWANLSLSNGRKFAVPERELPVEPFSKALSLIRPERLPERPDLISSRLRL